MRTTDTRLSIVIPVHDEAACIIALHRELAAVLDTLATWNPEVVYVNDGSTDDSPELLDKIALEDPRCRVVHLRRNFGQTAALAAGFDDAIGDVIVTMDADLQNDPADIHRLLIELDSGYDMVNGWRRQRKDAFLTRTLPSRLANWLISRVTGIRFHDFGCTLRAYRSDVVRQLSLYGELHRFIPALASLSGFAVTEIEVNHRPRVHGRSKYGISRTFRVVLDLLTVKFLLGYSARPGHLFGMWGLALSTIGTVTLGFLGFERVVFGVSLSNRPVLLLGVLFAVLGLNFIGIGLLAELITRTYHESTGRKTYLVRNITRSDDPT